MSMPGLPTLRPNRGGYVLESNAISLSIRQQPECALLTQENKEKGRKPIDPPPIVQMIVDRSCDPQEQWIVSPYLFMIAVIVEGDEGDTLLPAKFTVGQTSSSLHRLKDIDNKDGGFFVFGDISVRKLGKHRLRFNLFDTDKDTGDVILLKTIESDTFDVVSGKEFRGLSESSHLSRTFTDQGVRLRLRKEPRTIGGHSAGVKRSYGSTEQESPGIRAQTASYNSSAAYNYGSIKRARPIDDYSSAQAYSSYEDSTSPYYSAGALSSNISSSARPWEGYQKPQSAAGYNMGHRGSFQMGASGGQLARTFQNPTPGPVSAPATALSGASSYTSRSNYFDQGYQQQSGPYFSTSSADPYAALTELQTPSSIPDSGALVSSRGSNQGYIPSTTDFSVQSNYPKTEPQHTPYQQGIMPQSASSYSTRSPTSLDSTGQTYSTAASSYDAGSYTQPQQAAPSVQNPYSGTMSRMPYPANTGSMSHSSMPTDLFASTLNSGWPAFGDEGTAVSAALSNSSSITGHYPSGYPVQHQATKQEWG